MLLRRPVVGVDENNIEYEKFLKPICDARLGMQGPRGGKPFGVTVTYLCCMVGGNALLRVGGGALLQYRIGVGEIIVKVCAELVANLRLAIFAKARGFWGGFGLLGEVGAF